MRKTQVENIEPAAERFGDTFNSQTHTPPENPKGNGSGLSDHGTEPGDGNANSTTEPDNIFADIKGLRRRTNTDLISR